MISFFRKIRKQMANNNQVFKYSRYAIGEIVLVVIGILIALQINNWNEQKKINIDEKIILFDLKNEIISNVKELDKKGNFHQRALNDARKLREFIDHPEKLTNVSQDSIWKWTFRLGGSKINPDRGILNSIISSGQINIIRNNNLKYLISSLKEYEIEKLYLSNKLNDVALDIFANTIYPETIRISLNGINPSYDTNIEKYFNIKSIYLVPEFRVYIQGMFINNRRISMSSEKELKIHYEKIIELINIELEK